MLRGLADRAGRLDPAAATVFPIALQSLLTGAETAVSEVTAALARPGAGTPPSCRSPCRTSRPARPTSADHSRPSRSPVLWRVAHALSC